MTAVIGHDDGIDPVLDGKRAVLAGHDALENQLHARHVPDALHIVPAKLHAILTHERADCPEHVHRSARLGSRNFRKIAVATTAARVGLAVEVAHSDMLDRFGTYRVGSSVIDGPDE